MKCKRCGKRGTAPGPTGDHGPFAVLSASDGGTAPMIQDDERIKRIKAKLDAGHDWTAEVAPGFKRCRRCLVWSDDSTEAECPMSMEPGTIQYLLDVIRDLQCDCSPR